MKEVPPNCKPARRVTLTLTVGQERAILESAVYQITGSFADALRFWMIRGIEESLAMRAKNQPRGEKA